MRYYFVFLFAILTYTLQAQVMLPAYHGVQYKGGGGFASCGTLTINHKAANGVAPVDKTVTYGTVTGIPGEPTKCWITRNLGASQQADSVKDATEASAGWYWQFDRKQGYKHDGTKPPTWSSTVYNANTSWSAAQDPCTLELGAGWRIPTSTEWTNVDSSSVSNVWRNFNDQYNSGLKLHAAGHINNLGLVPTRGAASYYWSSSIASKGSGRTLYGSPYYSESSFSNTGDGLPLRCIKD